MADEQVAGMVVKLAMESGSFNDGIQSLNRQMKVVDSQFKAAVGGVKGFGNNLDDLKANSDRLVKSINIQEQVVAKYQERLNSSKNTLESNVQAQIKLEEELNKTKKAYDDSVSSLGKEASQTKELGKEVERLQKSYDDNQQKIRNNQKAIDNNTISVNNAQKKLNGFKVELDSTAQKLEKVSREANDSGSSFDKFKRSLTDSIKDTSIFGTKIGDLVSGFSGADAATAVLGGAIGGLTAKFTELAMEGIALAISAIKEFIASSLQIGIGFEAQMSRVQAITGETSKGLSELTDIARRFGADTVFTTREVAKAMEYMGMAGWKTEQIMGGMSGVLSLAAASGEDLALVSDTVTDVLTALGEEADQAGRMADVFAAAATNSNTNVGRMAYTMKYAAPIAGALSYSMEDVAIATGLMANAGIKGETAGTSLRSMFTKLLGTVEITGDALGKYVIETENADGSMRELQEIVVELRTAFSGLTESEKASNAEALVGREAMSGLLAIVNAGEKDFNKLSEAIYNSAGASEKMSKTMTANVDGLLKSMGSKFESIKISLYTLFEPLITWVLQLLDVIMAALEPILKMIADVGRDILNILTPIIETLVLIGDMIVDVIKGACELINDILNPVLEELGDYIGSIVEVIKYIGEAFRSGMEVIVSILKPLAKSIGEFFAATLALLTGDLKSFMDHSTNMLTVFTGKVEATNNQVENSTKKHYSMLESMAEEHSETMDELSKIGTDAMSKELAEYETKLKASFDETTRSGREAIRKRLDHKKEELEKSYRMEEEYYSRLSKLRKEKYSLPSSNNSNMPGYAKGTKFHVGGLALVGERGPEIVNLPRGAGVTTNGQTQQIMSGQSSSGDTYNFNNVTIQSNDAKDLFEQIQILTRRGGAY